MIRWQIYKIRALLWLRDKLQAWAVKDEQLSELILNQTFEALVRFVEGDGLNREWIGADAINAEFEINQCYVWWKQVRPLSMREVATFDDVELFLRDDQKYLERLIKVREWLR